MARRRPLPGFLVVFRTPELVGYRCRVCREEFGRDREAPVPTVCPRADRHVRPGRSSEKSRQQEAG